MLLYLYINKNKNEILCSDCKSRLFGEKNSFLVLSNHKIDITTAINICSASGGDLVQITSEERTSKLTSFLKKLLIEPGIKIFLAHITN